MYIKIKAFQYETTNLTVSSQVDIVNIYVYVYHIYIYIYVKGYMLWIESDL